MLLLVITTRKLQESCIIGNKCSGTLSGGQVIPCGNPVWGTGNQVIVQKCSGTPSGNPVWGTGNQVIGCQVFLFIRTLPQTFTHDGCFNEEVLRPQRPDIGGILPQRLQNL